MESLQKKIIDILCVRHKIDRTVVEHICRYPFIFTARVIRDDDDEKPIMIAHLGKFKVKKKFSGKKRKMADKFYQNVEKRKERYRLLNKTQDIDTDDK